MNAVSHKSLPEIQGYHILRLLAEGGMSSVYLAVQETLDRLVAIKILKRIAGDERRLDADLFERETLLLAQVSHPNIVRIIDRGCAEDCYYIVQEYVDGENLRTRMTLPIPIESVREIILSVGKATAALHSAGIVHRDLKPENVLLSSDNSIRVADLGAAVVSYDTSQTGESVPLATPDYAAPEQRYGLTVDGRADQYSIAVIAYELLTGQLPSTTVVSPSSYNVTLNSDVDRVILKSLHQLPDDRYASIEEFTRALDRAIGGCTLATGVAFSARHNFSRRWAWVVAPVVCVIIMFVVSRWWSEPANGTLSTSGKTAERTERIQQTGVLPFRVQDGVVEVLLVRNRGNTHWTVPKETQSSDATIATTVEEEAFEEAGVRGVVYPSPAGSYRYTRKDRRYRVAVYPYLVTETLQLWPENYRQRQWHDLESAEAQIAATELRAIVQGFRPPAFR